MASRLSQLLVGKTYSLPSGPDLNWHDGPRADQRVPPVALATPIDAGQVWLVRPDSDVACVAKAGDRPHLAD